MTKEEKMAAALDTKFTTEKRPLYDKVKGEYQFKGIDLFLEKAVGIYDAIKEQNLPQLLFEYTLETYPKVTPDMTTRAIETMREMYPFASPVYTDTIKLANNQIMEDLFPEAFVKDMANFIESGQADLIGDLVEEQMKLQEGAAADVTDVAEELKDSGKDDTTETETYDELT
jgi:hypothetical protein